MSLPTYVQQDDAAIATALVDAALSRGMTLSVNDGMEWTVQRSSDKEEVLSALASTGIDTLLVRDGDRKAFFSLVWGNGDGTLIADYGVSPLAEELYAAVQPTLERFDR